MLYTQSACNQTEVIVARERERERRGVGDSGGGGELERGRERDAESGSCVSVAPRQTQECPSAPGRFGVCVTARPREIGLLGGDPNGAWKEQKLLASEGS